MKIGQKGISTVAIVAIVVTVVVVTVVAAASAVILLKPGEEGATATTTTTPTTTPTTTTITGNVAKGLVSSATVKFFTLNANGTKGNLLGTTTTDSNGNFTVTLTVISDPIIAEASGGSYVNEVSGVTDTLSGSDKLTAVLPAGTTQVAITPLTNMAAARARTLVAAGIPLATAVDAANVGVAQQYNLPDILGILPVDANNATQVATSSRDQRDYGIILAGITQEAKNLNVWPIDLATALANDMEDGILDGLGGNPIQVPTIAGPVITLPPNAGTEALQNSINTFVASGNNLTNLVGTSISTTPVNINPAGGSFYITAAALPAWTEGQSGSATLTANGGTPPYTWSVTAGSALPNWLALAQQGNNVVLTGTAPLLSPGTTRSISPPFSVTCRDANGLSQAISWTVTIVKNPPVLTATTETVTAGVYFSVHIATASGGVPPCYVFACPARTPMGTIMNLDGVLQGTISQPGTYPFEAEAVDSIGSTSSTIITVIVTPPTSSIFPTSQSFDSNGGSNSVTVTSDSSWTAASGAGWITINSGSSGSGNGTVNYTVSANSSTSQRTGTITIAGQTFTVTQAGGEGGDVSQFDGSYSGSYSGPVSGSVAFTVSNGVITVTDPGSGSGTVSASGSTSFSGSGGYEGASYSFSGTFVVSNGTASAGGGWSGSYMGETASGTWSATRQ
jgi:hypothetical protein